MMMLEGPYDMIFQKGDSVALAVQNPLTIPPSCRSVLKTATLFSSVKISSLTRWEFSVSLFIQKWQSGVAKYCDFRILFQSMYFKYFSILNGVIWYDGNGVNNA